MQFSKCIAVVFNCRRGGGGGGGGGCEVALRLCAEIDGDKAASAIANNKRCVGSRRISNLRVDRALIEKAGKRGMSSGLSKLGD